MTPKRIIRVIRPPAACPTCGRKTSDNIARPKRAGLHCHTDDTKKWATNCGIVLCDCGTGYTKGAHSNPMSQNRGAR